LLRIGMICAGLVVPVLLVELTMVVFDLGGSPDADSWKTRGIHRADPDLIYSLRPGAESTWKFKQFDQVVHVNSLGLRDREVGPKHVDEVRILVLGDSMTFGHGVRNEESWPNQLEKILSADPGKRVDVINAAVKGYGTDHQYKFFRDRLVSLKPDILVLAAYGNDLVDNISHPLFTLDREGLLVELDASEDAMYTEGKLHGALPGLLSNSRLGRSLLPVLSSLVARETLPYQKDPEARDSFTWAGRKAYVAIYRLFELSKQHGFEFLVLGLPMRNWKNHSYWWLEPVIKEGIHVVDLDKGEEWRGQSETLFFEGDRHFSKDGNLWMAERAAASLRPLLK
ncbi:MAG: GDSL-type esterase/lipase family protein, partial [Planctomycetota bacterium]|nr:GDSL-type esterase/lipase family protein [Planctomycetota bacterium]